MFEIFDTANTETIVLSNPLIGALAQQSRSGGAASAGAGEFVRRGGGVALFDFDNNHNNSGVAQQNNRWFLW